MTASSRRLVPSLPNWVFISFIAVMTALMALFVVLGVWQMERLSEKEALVATVAARLNQPPMALPPQAEWSGLDLAALDFQPVSVTGTFVNDQAIRIFTALSDARGPVEGPGYWIMTPFKLTTGGSIFLNRGFVPQDSGAAFLNDPNGPVGVQTVTGVARRAELTGAFTPAVDAAERIDWVRTPQRLAQLTSPDLAPFIDIYIDLPADPARALPQGGETIVEFPNRHLEYAVTWFGFAAIVPIMLGYWVWSLRRKTTIAT